MQADQMSTNITMKPTPGALSGSLGADMLHKPKNIGLSNRKLTAVSVIVSAVLIVLIVVAGAILVPAAQQTDFAIKSLSPSLEHPFGTDWMGRSMFARTLSGLGLSIMVGLLAAIASSLIALILGAVAALGGKVADGVVSWMIDAMLGIPHIILLILISFALGGGFFGVCVGVALTHWPTLTRVIRAEILQCSRSDYVAAARKLGVSKIRIALTHMLPMLLPQFLVGMILMFPHAILHEAAITFLGFGLPPEQPAIGIILSESMSHLMAGMWWTAVIPGIALILVVMLFDLLGSGIRRMIDPYSSQE